MAEHIQIGDVGPRIQYAADGEQTEFTYPFPIFVATDLEVYLGGVLQEAGYTVLGAGLSTGGLCVFDAAPADGAVVTLRRRLAIARTADFQESGDFRAKVINDELDRLVAMVQQVADDAKRTLKLAPTDGDAEFMLPVKEDRKGKVLTFDAETGEPAAQSTDSFTGPQGPKGDPGDMSGENNLSELANSAAARANLGLGTASVANVAAGGAGNLLREDGDGSQLINLPATNAADVRLLALKIAALEGDRINMVDGIVDPFADESDVDEGSNANASYDSGNAFYSNEPSTSYLTGTAIQGYGSSPWAYLTDNNETTGSGGIPTVVAANMFFGTIDLGSEQVVHKLEVNGFYNSHGSTLTAYFEYSLDNLGWIEFGSFTFASTPVTRSVENLSGVTLRYWRLRYFSGGNDLTMGISGLNAYQYNPPPDMTLVSKSFAADSAPVAARLGLQIEPIDAVAIDTDIVGEVSRDGGATWTPAALAPVETLADGTEYHEDAEIDLSGQPGGTSMKWRVRTFNNKHIRVHGVVFQWRA